MSLRIYKVVIIEIVRYLFLPFVALRTKRKSIISMVVRPRINIIEIFSGQRRFRLAGDNFRDRLLTRSKQTVAGTTRVSSKKFQRDASTSGNVREYEIAFSANEQRYPFLFSFFYLFFFYYSPLHSLHIRRVR